MVRGGLVRGGAPSIRPGQLGGPFTAAWVKSAEEVLARSGVATVAKEGSKVALVTVVGPVRERFTRSQVESMALSAADGGGITGAALGSAVRTTKGLAPLVSARVLGAELAHAGVRGRASHYGYPGLAPGAVDRFPIIALPLFVSDVIASTPQRGRHAAGVPSVN